MGPTALIPLRRKECLDLYRPWSPSPSARIETANLRSYGRHSSHYTTKVTDNLVLRSQWWNDEFCWRQGESLSSYEWTHRQTFVNCSPDLSVVGPNITFSTPLSVACIITFLKVIIRISYPWANSAQHSSFLKPRSRSATQHFYGTWKSWIQPTTSRQIFKYPF
jgi:hypothetical protein